MNVQEIKTKIEQSTHPFVMGLIGENPSTYSKSRIMWNALFAFHGLSSEYIPFDVSQEEVSKVIELLIEHPRVIGFNATNPYKELVAQHPLIAVDKEARIIRGVNTIHRLEGKIIGHSTDGHGALRSLEEKTERSILHEKTVMILGAGGSGAAIAVACANNGAKHVAVANRNHEKAQDLSLRAGGFCDTILIPVRLYSSGWSYSDLFLGPLSEADIVINTIPIEKTTGKPLFTNGELKGKKKICMDAVYGHHSHFLKTAAQEGHTAISGEWMLLHQAVRAFEHVYHDEIQSHHLSRKDIEAPMRYALKNFTFDESNESIKRKIELARKEIH